jgi:tetratricopeptide (TPR) repeat protein
MDSRQVLARFEAERQALALMDHQNIARVQKYKISEPHREWLRAVLEAAEPDDVWGQKVRAARRETDAVKRQAALEALTKSAKVAELPALALDCLAYGLRPLQAATLLRRAQRQYPTDFWVNENLGKVLEKIAPAESNEAVRFLTAAVALRPESPGAHLTLGIELYHKGQLDEAIPCYQKTLELDPKYANAHNNLGAALYGKGQRDEAIAAAIIQLSGLRSSLTC